MIEQLTNNWICWAILLLALTCYQQLWLAFLHYRQLNSEAAALTIDGPDKLQEEFSGVLIGALPLLGLLGTIIGLLDCFTSIATDGASSELMSGGIADALLTTQLGLVCAIPAWLLHTWVRSSSQRQLTTAVAR